MKDTLLAANAAAPLIDRDRLLSRLAQMATFGDLGNGGVCRLALSPEETEARIIVMQRAQELGCSVTIDAIGNIFLRRAGDDPDAAPVLTGSHLDSQPAGGNFDGVLGVIAALECLEVLAERGLHTRRPLDVVIWCNEEGARFRPTTMGSAVWASHLPLETALAATDKAGESAAHALDIALSETARRIVPQPLKHTFGHGYDSYVELHIEQGPILEAEGLTIGVVTDVQGFLQYRVTVAGVAGHAGAVRMKDRDDALSNARRLLDRLEAELGGLRDLLFTVGRLDVVPGAINTIPSEVSFTLDIRHPDSATLAKAAQIVEGVAADHRVEKMFTQPPVTFAPRVIDAVRDAATDMGYSHRDIVSGATHDAVQVASLCPSGMIFVPCRKGISHNPAEYCAPDFVVAGTETLLRTIFALAEVTECPA